MIELATLNSDEYEYGRLEIKQPTQVICTKHGYHSHTIVSNIAGHEGTWCLLCALEKLGESLPTTDD